MNLAAAVPTEIDDRKQELIALARLLTYARDTAESLEAEVTAFCISSAISTIMEQFTGDAVGSQALSEFIDLEAARSC